MQSCDRSERRDRDRRQNRRMAKVGMLRFDASDLVERLDSLPPPLRAIFAAACAERLLPAYLSFRGKGDDASTMSRALARIWLEPSPGEQGEAAEIEIEQIMAITPQDDGFDGVWDQSVTNAQNAGMSVVYALRAKLSGMAQEAAWAAQVAYEALDNYVSNKEYVNTSKPSAESPVISHPLVQAELARQGADLHDLETASSDAYRAVIEQLHTRAKVDAARFFRG